MKRTGIVFGSGLLCGVLLLVGTIFGMQLSADDADAQSDGTWNHIDFGPTFEEDQFNEDLGIHFDEWVDQLSADCDIEFATAGSGIDVAYRCP